ncbi:hypothetical protein A3I51_04940 [Candidatus Gottesmanbacteria bacterium RIFCSPLOWO2_02_FULL_38_8]|uniref:PABS domain-containing protein n=1 Tax=Candidatus Gottesmanbacteria bacterium RIFCSPLOWO2_02_FULL_38_8 TaxID=1798397 RepID=A0A1F6B2P3_9BACT|nr:MAG: hypothetical protein A3I51_04940 [Candidatus Gottesmanbacteria bacterium RIFCSPLOWO2_02_FULL_38_8]
MKFSSIFFPKIITDFKSDINKNIQVVQKRGRKVIYVDGAEQTGGTITGMWQKALSNVKSSRLSGIPQAAGQMSNVQNALVLGLGGGDIIRLLHRVDSQIKVTAVDIDPVMIKIARDLFGIRNSSNLKIHNHDALYYLLLNREKFSLIVVDLFIGYKNPQKFRSPRFLNLLQKSRQKNGLILFNSHYHSDFNNEFEEFHNLCTQIFSTVEIIINYPYSKILLLK